MKSVSSGLQCCQLRLTDFAPSVRSRGDTVSVLYFLLLGVLRKLAVGTPYWGGHHGPSSVQRGRRKVDADAGPTRRGSAPIHSRAMVERVSLVPGTERDLPRALPTSGVLPLTATNEGHPVELAAPKSCSAPPSPGADYARARYHELGVEPRSTAARQQKASTPRDTPKRCLPPAVHALWPSWS